MRGMVLPNSIQWVLATLAGNHYPWPTVPAMCIRVDAIGSPMELPIDDDTLVEVEIDDLGPHDLLVEVRPVPVGVGSTAALHVVDSRTVGHKPGGVDPAEAAAPPLTAITA